MQNSHGRRYFPFRHSVVAPWPKSTWAFSPTSLSSPESADKALYRVVAVGEAEPLDQVLEDGLGIATAFDLLLDPGAVFLAGQADLFHHGSRWPGWGIFNVQNPAFAAVRAGGHPGGI